MTFGTPSRTTDARIHDGAPARLDPASWPSNEITVANLGHATLLLNYFGVRVIDPTLFDHVGLAIDSLLTIGPPRMVEPPLKPAQLEPLDIILITHAHMGSAWTMPPATAESARRQGSR